MGKYIVILFQISSSSIIQIGAMQHYTAAIGNLIYEQLQNTLTMNIKQQENHHEYPQIPAAISGCKQLVRYLPNKK